MIRHIHDCPECGAHRMELVRTDKRGGWKLSEGFEPHAHRPGCALDRGRLIGPGDVSRALVELDEVWGGSPPASP